MYRFTAKTGAPQASPSCEGDYLIDESRGVINDKPVYVNKENGLFLAAHPAKGWCITGLNYLSEVQRNQGYFGGFCFGGNSTPADGSWETYEVLESVAFLFTQKSGKDNYANCNGCYIEDKNRGTINGQPVYVNETKNLFLAAQPGSGWVITSLQYFPEIKTNQGSFGGFHSVADVNPDSGNWNSYAVKKYGGRSETNETLSEGEVWEKLENTNISFKAVANSGVVRTEADFKAMRQRCLAMDCGGFSWRKPHFNQFGEEDDPPVCFFYRETQTELRKAMQCSDSFDFYLAPKEFCPDCSFKPFRDPAPSCHIRWQVDEPVHAFACQVLVPEATPYTYYCAAGFHCGYSGIQQHNAKKQQILFSVWDDLCASDKVSNSFVCPGLTAKPFGGEGKGMQIIGVSDSSIGSNSCSLATWVPGHEYTLVVQTKPISSGTEFICFIHKPECGWVEMGRDVRPEPCRATKGTLSGLYSFIEDFTGNSLRRRAIFSAWTQVRPGSPWVPVNRITGTSTAEDCVPNKCVRLMNEGNYERVEMISGGEALTEFPLYEGKLNPKPVPTILYDLGI